MVAAAAALLMVGATGALYYYGLPAWAQGLGLGGATGEPDLVIELPPNQDHRELPDGTIYFAASGSSSTRPTANSVCRRFWPSSAMHRARSSIAGRPSRRCGCQIGRAACREKWGKN